MKNLCTLAVFAVFAAMAMGCTNVTSGLPASTAVTGEGWYTKSTGIPGGVTFSTSVYWCSKDAPEKCTKAEMRDR
jgi:hypothetical protein